MLIATAYLGVGTQPVEFAMSIGLEEVVVQDVSDDALELAAGGAQGGPRLLLLPSAQMSTQPCSYC